jgi:predicted DNA-binding transcriptional regulator YafY
MTACSELPPEEIEALLPAYRILLRIAREKKAAASAAIALIDHLAAERDDALARVEGRGSHGAVPTVR